MSPETLAIREAILALPEQQKRMTVRGVFYALTVRGIVEKSTSGYRKVQRQALLLRRAELLSWTFIADSTRWVREPETWDSTDDVLREVARTYRRNLWRSQQVRIEIWLEKDALASVIADVTHAFGVRLMVSRGQSSDTYLHSAAQDARAAWEQAGVETIVYALYDSDRWGRDAARKVEQKLRAYSRSAPITFALLAVTDGQIDAWKLPTRFDGKNRNAVELDAIPPDKLTALVEKAIREHINADAWQMELAAEENEREVLRRMTEERA